LSSQLKLSSSRLSRHGGETGRRISRRREEKYESTSRRSRRRSNTFKHKTKTEKQLNRSQFCAQQYKLRLESLLLVQTHHKGEHIQNGQEKRKNTIRYVCKRKTEILHPEKSACNNDLNMKQTIMNSKPQPGKTLRRIKTFLSKSRKDQLESEGKVSASCKYFKYVKTMFKHSYILVNVMIYVKTLFIFQGRLL
jgi:hypothetical protein